MKTNRTLQLKELSKIALIRRLQSKDRQEVLATSQFNQRLNTVEYRVREISTAQEKCRQADIKFVEAFHAAIATKKCLFYKDRRYCAALNDVMDIFELLRPSLVSAQPMALQAGERSANETEERG